MPNGLDPDQEGDDILCRQKVRSMQHKGAAKGSNLSSNKDRVMTAYSPLCFYFTSVSISSGSVLFAIK